MCMQITGIWLNCRFIYIFLSQPMFMLLVLRQHILKYKNKTLGGVEFMIIIILRQNISKY
jgi:hypothetical protein